MELWIHSGGRWRRVCARSGRVAGWARRARLALARGGALHDVTGQPLLQRLRKGPRLPTRPRRKKKTSRVPPELPTSLACRDESTGKSVGFRSISIQTDSDPVAGAHIHNGTHKLPREKSYDDHNKENAASDKSAQKSLTKDFNTQKMHVFKEADPIERNKAIVGGQVHEEGPTGAGTKAIEVTKISDTQRAPSSDPVKQVEVRGDIVEEILSKKHNNRVGEKRSDSQRIHLYRKPSPREETSGSEGAGAGAGEGAGAACKELVIPEEDVCAVRRYAETHHTDIDLLRFDEDDGYKALVFYSINPVVRLRRSARVARLLRARFAGQLGLRSVRSPPHEPPPARPAAPPAAPPPAAPPAAPARRIRTALDVPTASKLRPIAVPKRSSVRTGRSYGAAEDLAIVSWLSAAPRRERAVNGNRLWRELQPVYCALTGRERTWHSLRNRYLRYILPALGALSLGVAPRDAQRLRAHAALGELKSRKKERRNSALYFPALPTASRPAVGTRVQPQRSSRSEPRKISSDASGDETDQNKGKTLASSGKEPSKRAPESSDDVPSRSRSEASQDRRFSLKELRNRSPESSEEELFQQSTSLRRNARRRTRESHRDEPRERSLELFDEKANRLRGNARQVPRSPGKDRKEKGPRKQSAESSEEEPRRSRIKTRLQTSLSPRKEPRTRSPESSDDEPSRPYGTGRGLVESPREQPRRRSSDSEESVRPRKSLNRSRRLSPSPPPPPRPPRRARRSELQALGEGAAARGRGGGGGGGRPAPRLRPAPVHSPKTIPAAGAALRPAKRRLYNPDALMA